MLRAGESREVTFTLTPDDLSFWRLDNKWGQEPGDYHVWAGTIPTVRSAAVSGLPNKTSFG